MKMTEFDPFAAYDWPADPAAYRVETTRDANVIATIAVLVQADGRPLLTLDWTQRDTEGAAQAILADALAYGRYAPDAMPSDEHIILAAMEHCGITPDEDGEPELDASGIEGSVPVVDLAQLGEARDALMAELDQEDAIFAAAGVPHPEAKPKAKPKAKLLDRLASANEAMRVAGIQLAEVGDTLDPEHHNTLSDAYDAINDLTAALSIALPFMEGFEGDEVQGDDFPADLERIRATLAKWEG